MNPLQSRKQLLIAESELNRAQLVQEWQTMTDEAHTLARQARTISSIAAAAASLVTGLASFRRPKSAPAAGTSSWVQTILTGAQQVGSLWSQFRARRRDRDGV